MKSSILSLSITVALSGLFGSAYAQAPGDSAILPAITPPPAGTKLNDDDAKFLDTVALTGLSEIQDGNLASKKGHSDDVKELAKKITADHIAANNQAKELASSYKVKLPTNVADSDILEHQRLSGLHGTDFDKAYVEDEVKDQQTAIELFQKESNSGQDPTLKQFASNVLPILKDHLKAAQALQPDATATAPSTPAAADAPATPAPPAANNAPATPPAADVPATPVAPSDAPAQPAPGAPAAPAPVPAPPPVAPPTPAPAPVPVPAPAAPTAPAPAPPVPAAPAGQ